MCGRFALTITGDAVAAAMQATPVLPAFVEALAAWQGRFNIAPTSVIPIVVGRSGPRPEVAGKAPRPDDAAGAGLGERSGAGGIAHELLFARWGLIPFWAKEASIGAKLSNARSDTIAVKPAFREAWKSRRCLVPATAFYEWQVPADGSPKRPHAIASSSGELLALGGIWERWRDPADGTEVRTVAIVTTDANELMEPIHNRMPVIVPSEAWEQWLGAAVPPASLLRPYAADRMQAWRVSTVVNNARNDRPECLVPLGN